MAVPVAPAAGEPIAEAWGDVVHDSIVAMDIQSGSGTLTWTGTAASDVPTIIFPRPFATTPVVVCILGANASAANINVGLRQLSSAQFQAQGREVRETATTGAMAFQWLAYGPRA